VIAVNRPIDAEAAEEMHQLFLEVIAAPGFDEAAKARFATKKNLRLVEVKAAPQKWFSRMYPAESSCKTTTRVLCKISTSTCDPARPTLEKPAHSCSPGRSASTSSPMPSSTPATVRRSGSVPAR